MLQQMHCTPQADPSRNLTLCQWKALRLLNEAWLAAYSEGCDIWQFAVEIGQFRVLGLSHTNLRCLVSWGYLDHAQERTTAGAHQRIFQHLSTLVLPKRTCFVLTAKGRKVASEHETEKESAALRTSGERIAVPGSLTKVPRWDAAARQLWWQEYLVKEFRRPAENQETVLAALEEEGWPKQIDDPLPGTPGISAKDRLHDTIKCLNRHQFQRIICFRGDGRGTGVGWMIAGGSEVSPC